MNRVVILAGGRGSRMGDATEIVPKPMVKIGEIPIIEHIMNNFNRFLGECEFIIAAGYKQEIIREYFSGWLNVSVVDTGIETQTAGRLRRLKSYLKGEPFFLCYGDGLTDFDLSSLSANPEASVTMLVVHPSGRFGEIEFVKWSKRVVNFNEKPIQSVWINGGYFYINPDIFDYITDDSDILEINVFSKLVSSGKLYCCPYSGYWHCMDTPKDHAELSEEYRNGDARWQK